MRKDSDIQSMMKDVTEQLGPIDVLVNNEGSMLRRMKAVELDEATWNEILNLNLSSAALCSRAVGASMIERRRRDHQRGFDRRTKWRRAGHRDRAVAAESLSSDFSAAIAQAGR